MAELEHYPEEIFPIDGLENRKDLGYKIINIVLIPHIECPINLKYLFTCLPIAEVNDFTVKKGSKINIPYFGHERIFVSANFEGESKGIRIINKPFKNVLYVDFQCCGKNQHIKISESNLHITGVRSQEVGVECINKVLDKIREINDMILFARSLSKEDKNFFVEILSTREDIESKIYQPQIEDKNNLYNFLTVNRSKRIKDNYEGYINYLYYVLFGEQFLYNGSLKIKKVVVHNKVYYIDIGFLLNIKKINVLSEIQGHKVNYHNWDVVQQTEIIVDDKDGKTTIKIAKSGGINFWTDSNEGRGFRAFRKILDIIDKCKLTKKNVKKKYVRKTPRNFPN